jgi:DNA polymerase-3 subunit delta
VKIDGARVAGFLKDPGQTRAVLLYGDDEGLIRERARALTTVVAGTTDDPFQIAELARDGWGQIATEFASLSLMGGRRVVRVREVTDAALEPVRTALKTRGDGLLVLEAPGLGKGKLRTFVEAGTDTAAIACYPEEGAARQDSIRRMLSQAGVSADGDMLVWLAETTAGDRAVLASEVEKLILLGGAGKRVTLEDAREVTGDSAGAEADTAMLAAMRGEVALADQAVERSLGEGMNPVALIRVVMGHLQRMHLARLRMHQGMSASDAARSLRPPLFFKAVGAFTAGLALWREDALARALLEARAVEIGCKQTGSPAELSVRRLVSTLARQSQARARGGT